MLKYNIKARLDDTPKKDYNRSVSEVKAIVGLSEKRYYHFLNLPHNEESDLPASTMIRLAQYFGCEAVSDLYNKPPETKKRSPALPTLPSAKRANIKAKMSK